MIHVERKQQDRAAQTRDTILEAAAKVLFEEGYSAATTLHIQQVAGVSRGRLLHHFPSRELLLTAAVHHLADVRITELTAGVAIPDDLRERIRFAVAAMWEITGQSCFWATMELWMGARTANPELREALSDVERRMLGVLRARADELFGPQVTASPEYLRTREVMITSMRGARLAYTFHPRDPETEPALANWEAMFEAILPLVGSRMEVAE
ncbi:TetR/AcrR family transcriptional regulator [Gordonia sp. PDNC005]|uniref:TetR/AcrR family transcriptional regulator n=1 Tax=unclassified Gordonia (in: high G+C Gram-positive bacteria) TaxID=2657482 RepID=UPI001966C7B3|nr:TetR/AcrR family transcriptional regulator [Gordonia sp. PDNC005]QRY62235.1 TetR/AcrR family transcriptional regulator [Gordonia sp. PDNC005]